MTEEKQNEEKENIEQIVSEIEKSIFALKFYPVAVDENAKNEAQKNLIRIYKKGNETVKQLVLFMLHEALSQYYDFKTVHVYDYFKARNPQGDPTQLRMEVYKAIFNYNTSIEGAIDIINTIAKLGENDDAAKLLSYHYTRIASIEVESHIELRNAIINSLGDCDSTYALTALMTYARHTDNEHLLQRIQVALNKWDKKIEKLKLPSEQKKKLKNALKEVIIKESEKSPYR